MGCFSSVLRSLQQELSDLFIQVYFWFGVFSLVFLTNGSRMDKPIKTLGSGHCLHLSSSGLLATPRLTGRGNAGPSRLQRDFGASCCPSSPLMPRQSTAQPGHASSVPTSLFQPLFLPLLSSPASSPGCSRRGFPPGLRSSCHWEQAQVLVATRKSPGSTGHQMPQDGRSCPCSEQ